MKILDRVTCCVKITDGRLNFYFRFSFYFILFYFLFIFYF